MSCLKRLAAGTRCVCGAEVLHTYICMRSTAGKGSAEVCEGCFITIVRSTVHGNVVIFISSLCIAKTLSMNITTLSLLLKQWFLDYRKHWFDSEKAHQRSPYIVSSFLKKGIAYNVWIRLIEYLQIILKVLGPNLKCDTKQRSMVCVRRRPNNRCLTAKIL